MSDVEFFAFLDTCRGELFGLQTLFQQRIEGGGQWSYDLSDCTLRIGNETFPITPVSTYSPEHETWLWAWANDEFPFPRARDAAKNIQSLQTTRDGASSPAPVLTHRAPTPGFWPLWPCTASARSASFAYPTRRFILQCTSQPIPNDRDA